MVNVSIRRFEPADYMVVRKIFTDGLCSYTGLCGMVNAWYVPRQLEADMSDVHAHYLARPGHNFWVAIDSESGALVGCIGAQPGSKGAAIADADGDVELRRLSVAGPFQRRGVAQQLVRALEEWARAEGFKRVVLSTLCLMDDACRFYTALGYNRDGTKTVPMPPEVKNGAAVSDQSRDKCDSSVAPLKIAYFSCALDPRVGGRKRKAERELAVSSGGARTSTSTSAGTDHSISNGLACAICKRSFKSLSALHSHCIMSHPGLCVLDVSPHPGAITAAKAVVYEDEHMACLVKPQGLTTNEFGHSDALLCLHRRRAVAAAPRDAAAAEETNDASAGANGNVRADGGSPVGAFAAADALYSKAEPVHRLDKETGGLLLVAKTHRCNQELSRMFRERQIHKVYTALVMGPVVAASTSDAAASAGEDAAANTLCVATQVQKKSAHTVCRIGRRFRLLRPRADTAADASARSGDTGDSGESDSAVTVTQVELLPSTGRKHQLRKHMLSIGHPIVGDQRYGRNWKSDGSDNAAVEARACSLNLCLWAVRLNFQHPFTGEKISISIDEPHHFGLSLVAEDRD